MSIERIKSLLEIVNSNEKLKDQLNVFSDVIFLDEPDISFEDDFDDVSVELSIERVCAFAEDGSGGRFSLLSDNTIGFESSEGQTDRIARNINDFLELIVYCPYWMDFCGVRSIRYQQNRREFFTETENERIDSVTADGMDYHAIQIEIAQGLGVDAPVSTFDVSEKFFESVISEPRFYGVCSEEDSDETWETERLFKTVE